MRKLEFIGTVRTGNGKFAQDMVIPGQADLFLAPIDWPTQLAPGTLNIKVNDDGFPEGFEEIGSRDGLKKLEEGKFRASLGISSWRIQGNTLKYDSDNPTRGMALLWRAELQVIADGRVTTCWMLRRLGSDITSEIELVAEEHLRSRLNLCDDVAVKVTVWETEVECKRKTPAEIIEECCDAARGIAAEFGTQNALEYLVGEKFLQYLESAENLPDFRAELPAFVAKINSIFERWQLAAYLDQAGWTEPFDPSDYEEKGDDDEELIEVERQDNLRRAAKELLLLEQAKGWLLNEE
jgi:hypothetical protein